MGLKDKILHKHPDPHERWKEKQRKMWENKQNKHEKEEHKQTVKKVFNEAKRKAEIQRAKIEGRKAGLRQGGSVSSRVSGALTAGTKITGEMTKFMVGDDFQFGAAFGGNQTGGNKKKKKKQQGNDPLWDMI